jgi:hypothetical protein
MRRPPLLGKNAPGGAPPGARSYLRNVVILALRLK